MNQVKRFREVFCPVLVRDIPKLHIVLEKLGFALKRVRHGVLRVDVPLRAVHDTEEAELQRVHPSREYVKRVRARIHQVLLRQDADCPSPWGSTDRASLSESEFARSTFAAETTRIMLALCE